MRRVVVLCRYLPDRTQSSGELRFDHILRHLIRRAERLVIFSEHPGNRHLFADVPVRPIADLRQWREPIDLAFLEFWFMATYLRLLRARGARVVLDSVDVEFVRRSREARLIGADAGYWRLERRRERDAYRKVDQVWAVSDADAVHIRPLARDMAVVPNIFTRPVDVPGPEERQGLCFVGSFFHQPNVDGLRWYRDHVFPRLQDIPHTIVGNGAPPDLAAMPGFVGHVPDSTVCVRHARVSIAPLRYGAGLKGKVLEAWACGTPVVTTTIGDEGYGGATSGASIAADDPDAFVQAVRRLMEDDAAWRAMSAQGLAIAARYSPDVVAPVMDKALARVSAWPALA